MAKESREEMRGWYQDITYFKEIVRDKVNWIECLKIGPRGFWMLKFRISIGPTLIKIYTTAQERICF
jgi:hypothetical protein